LNKHEHLFEYEAYQNMLQQKEIGLLHKATELKQENKGKNKTLELLSFFRNSLYNN